MCMRKIYFIFINECLRSNKNQFYLFLEKRQYLKKEAVKAQIDLDTAVLNKISAMRDSHRKEAMEALEDWRSKAEIPILKYEQGITQENRKAYKYVAL